MIFKLLITLFYWTINAIFDVCFTYDWCLGMPLLLYCVIWWCLLQVRNYTVWLLIATRPCLRGWTSTTDPGACQLWGSDRVCQVQWSPTNNIIITSIPSRGMSSALKKGECRPLPKCTTQTLHPDTGVKKRSSSSSFLGPNVFYSDRVDVELHRITRDHLKIKTFTL